MNNSGDTAGVQDGAEGFVPVKAGEEIIGEESFRHPDRSLAARAFEAETGQENFEMIIASEMSGGDVFVFQL